MHLNSQASVLTWKGSWLASNRVDVPRRRDFGETGPLKSIFARRTTGPTGCQREIKTPGLPTIVGKDILYNKRIYVLDKRNRCFEVRGQRPGSCGRGARGGGRGRGRGGGRFC